MKISVRWLNQYLDPAGVSAQEVEDVLTNVGFPIEEAVSVAGGDTMLDVEVTSNRGDCLSHIGLAREIAAATGRRLRLPEVPSGIATPGDVPTFVSLENQVPDLCRLFTLRVIRGVKIGPSPAWMTDALAAVGQRPINNVVDASNYVLFEWGQPTHTFDLAKIAREGDGVARIIVRHAHRGEKLTLLDGKTVTLEPNELVVADASGATSLAGIMGGQGSEVSDTTVDVLLEAATWDPATIRRAARRLQLGTDASHRFERLVDPRTIDLAARRVADLIIQTGGPNATLVSGCLQAGKDPEPLTRVSMRPARARLILGMDVPTPDMVRILRSHDIAVEEARGDEALACTIPPHRPDLEREIDLIEEVARTNGLGQVPTLERIPVRVAAPQESELAARELAGVLTGLGFFETITFSFVSPKDAAPFLPKEMELIQLRDDHRKADPALRPSILPSLLACRRANQDAGVQADGGVRLYETASTFGQSGKGASIETRVLALYADAVSSAGSSKGFEAKQESFRLMRGVIESIVRALGGPNATIDLQRADMPFSGLDPSASARVELRTPSGQTKQIGHCGLVGAQVIRAYDLDTPAVAAELNLTDLLALYPPRSVAKPLPLFPGIERDLTFIVPEQVAWGSLDQLIAGAKLDRLEGWRFVTSYRGTYRDAQNVEHHLGKERKKALTVRLNFRDPSRTLRHEEVDPQVATVVQMAADTLGAELRA